MGLWEQAQKDLARFTANISIGPAKVASFTTPDGSITQSIPLVPTKHHLEINEEGKTVNAKHASICFSEQILAATGYPIRNSSNEVAMINHRVNWTDSSGLLCQYIVREEYPDEALGLVVLILGDFE